MQVVIHAGMHKTGTTSLQASLATHREFLARHGVIYPARMAHHNVNLSVNPDWSPDWCSSQYDDARRRGAAMLLFSGEVVSTLGGENLRRLAAAFPERVRLVLCFRHWSGYWPSRWSQYSWRRDSQTWPEYVADVSGSSHVDRRFDQVLDDALSAGDVTAVSYDNAMTAGGDALPSILRAIGIDDALTAQLASRKRLGSRNDWRELELIRILNGVVANRRGLEQNSLFRSIGKHVPGYVKFGFGLSGLSADLLEAARAVVESRRKEVSFRAAGIEAVEDRMQEMLGLFHNPVDGRIFPAAATSKHTYTDLTWMEFEREHPTMLDAMLRSIGCLSTPASL